MPYRIAVLPGDGIGPEVMEPTLQIAAVAASKAGVEIEFTSHVFGAGHYRDTGEALSQPVVEDCKAADAVLLGALGLPSVRTADGIEIQPTMMMGLRRALDVYAAVRPIKRYAGVKTPLSTDAKIDFVILRENLEGLFASFGGGSILNDEVATDTQVITRRGTDRISRFAFELSKKRNGRPLDGKRLVTCVDKANIFRSFAFFRKVFDEVAADYPDIATDHQYVDAASMLMLQRPEAYDVAVMENQFGDILSDLGAGFVGGLGMAPSGEIGDEFGLFQPSHGSAPDIAGRGLANPIAMILSAGMMFEWLGDVHQDKAAKKAGTAIESAVAEMLAGGGPMTKDIGGSASTGDVASAVLECIANE
ncbi:MAG: isocitrate/isopropylmalate dehydrogenase family protein [Planctomycetota bacterium]|nr:isocitrate/isopropylmalate dehydrogenase family protein [Planctomycetota bacterium]MDA1252086.1 isocitrate/isopropylmalate dehydrogenase family protein [Planctomycetota bacterium]